MAKDTTTQRTFSFDTSFVKAVPEEVTKAKRSAPSNMLPFKGLFSGAEAKVLKGEAAEWFIPHAYWIEERGAAKDKVTDAFTKEKIRGAFRAWLAEAEGRDKSFNLHLFARTGKEEGYSEPGLSVWLAKRTA